MTTALPHKKASSVAMVDSKMREDTFVRSAPPRQIGCSDEDTLGRRAASPSPPYRNTSSVSLPDLFREVEMKRSTSDGAMSSCSWGAGRSSASGRRRSREKKKKKKTPPMIREPTSFHTFYGMTYILFVCCFPPVSVGYLLFSIYFRYHNGSPPLVFPSNISLHFPIWLQIWAAVEIMFYLYQYVRLSYMQRQCPLESALGSGPLLTPSERSILWERILDSEGGALGLRRGEREVKPPPPIALERDDLVRFITGWFFDAPLDSISRADVSDFLCWCMFDGRAEEHLTAEEGRELRHFLVELEWGLSLRVYGAANFEWGEEKEGATTTASIGKFEEKMMAKWMMPRKFFRFPVHDHETRPNFFSSLYETLHSTYNNLPDPAATATATTAALASLPSRAAEAAATIPTRAANAAAHIIENASTALDRGTKYYSYCLSEDLSALSSATYLQLQDAWDQIIRMRDRAALAKQRATARLVAVRNRALRRRLRGYRVLLDRMIKDVPSVGTTAYTRRLADMMRSITDINNSLSQLEKTARGAYAAATGLARDMLPAPAERLPYAKYSTDAIQGISKYPIVAHLMMVAYSEGGLRIAMHRRGFVRFTVGSISYYYHPGVDGTHDECEDPVVDLDANPNPGRPVPVVFCHGIGVGNIYYLSFIDRLLGLGRPIFLPDIPYVTCFRAWQSTQSVIPPHDVSSTLTAMLASHGFARAVFVGHSYGTSWLSYCCKYAPKTVVGLVFIDPICFCLHQSFLTKQFVYTVADPGDVSYLIRSDVMVHWTIQRGFPWPRVALFTEQISCNAAVFLSECDELVPSANVSKYLKRKEAIDGDAVLRTLDETSAEEVFGGKKGVSVTMFPGTLHGGCFTEKPCEDKIVQWIKILDQSAAAGRSTVTQSSN